jgi:alginate O-acetyltransferase complex protein AlgI
MLFSSGIFLLYFLPFFLGIYHLLDRRFKNGFVLLASLLFYAWGGPLFIFVLCTTTLIDFLLVRWMSAIEDRRKRRWALWVSVGMNVGLLAVFKYGYFIADSANGLGGLMGAGTWKIARWAPPLAISFFTFESITYVVDVYRKVHPPLRRFQDYLLYILLFPKLLAGPIVRYHEIGDQLHNRFDKVNADMLLTGFYRFVTGLAKKVLIANVLGLHTSKVFLSDYSQLDAMGAWLGLMLFALQIYFDFSGYSDMALGLCKMMGFRLPENFNNPYLSRSVTEYWQRWHITLGNWMKNYLYLPLGGNRVKTKGRLYLNLAIVFLLCGLWHGNTWNFVIWGAWHGSFMVMERAFLSKWLERVPSPIRMIYNFSVVALGCLFFCTGTPTAAGLYAQALVTSGGSNPLPMGMELWLTAGLAVIFSLWAGFKPGLRMQQIWYGETFTFKGHLVMALVTMFLLILCAIHVVWSPINPFIYFRF